VASVSAAAVGEWLVARLDLYTVQLPCAPSHHHRHRLLYGTHGVTVCGAATQNTLVFLFSVARATMPLPTSSSFAALVVTASPRLPKGVVFPQTKRALQLTCGRSLGACLYTILTGNALFSSPNK